jgi:hypothetical protein
MTKPNVQSPACLSPEAWDMVAQAVRSEHWFEELIKERPDQAGAFMDSVQSQIRLHLPRHFELGWLSFRDRWAPQVSDPGDITLRDVDTSAPPEAIPPAAQQQFPTLTASALPPAVTPYAAPPPDHGAAPTSPPYAPQKRAVFKPKPPAPAPRPPAEKFQIANARQGQGYQAQIVRLGKESQPLQVRDVRLPPGALGLSFDPLAGAVVGTPEQAGEFKVTFQWQSFLAWMAGECVLTVAPDPKRLWKDLDPPPPDQSEYHKANTDRNVLQHPQVLIAAASCRGRSHAHVGKFRDDDFFVWHDTATQWSALVVCDGAGSAEYSRKGSLVAASEVGAALVRALSGESGHRLAKEIYARPAGDPQAMVGTGRRFHDIYADAALRAVEAIEREADDKGRSARDYATTLLATAVRKDAARGLFVASLWIGDGAIGVYNPGRIRLMGRPDSGEYAGQTQFLDRVLVEDPGFLRRISVGLFADALAVLAMTDGVSDPVFETDAGMADVARWDRLWSEIEPMLQHADCDALVLDWMQRISVTGHYDDRTLAVLR